MRFPWYWNRAEGTTNPPKKKGFSEGFVVPPMQPNKGGTPWSPCPTGPPTSRRSPAGPHPPRRDASPYPRRPRTIPASYGGGRCPYHRWVLRRPNFGALARPSARTVWTSLVAAPAPCDQWPQGWLGPPRQPTLGRGTRVLPPAGSARWCPAATSRRSALDTGGPRRYVARDGPSPSAQPE